MSVIGARFDNQLDATQSRCHLLESELNPRTYLRVGAHCGRASLRTGEVSWGTAQFSEKFISYNLFVISRTLLGICYFVTRNIELQIPIQIVT